MTTVAHATISVAQVGSATVSSFTAAGSTSTLSNVPIAAGTNRLLVVSASDAASTGIVSVTYNGASMTRAVEKSDTSQAVDAFFYYLLGTSGSASTGTIVVLSNGSPSATGTQTIGAVVFQNVDQTTPVTSPVSNNDVNGMTPNPSLTVVSKANDLVYDLLDVYNATAAPAATQNSPQTLVYTHNGALTSGGFGTYSTSSQAGAASVNTGWAAATNQAYIQIAIDINVAVQPPTITTATLPNWTVNKSGYLQTVVATGGTGASTFSVTAGALPTGLTLGTSTGVVSGTPTAGGTYNFTITATDTVNATGSQAYTIVVNAAVSVSPSTLPNWTINKSGYLQTVTSSGGTGARALSLTSGAIPTGMTFTAGTGVLSGTPTAAGTFNFTITATDTVNATGSQAYTIVVNAAVSVTTLTLPNWTINKTGYLQTVTSNGGTGARALSLTSGAIPTGMTFTAGTGSTPASDDSGTRVVLNGIKLQAVATSNNIAASLDADGKNGTLIGFLPSTGQGFVLTLTPDSHGNYSGTTTTVGGTGAATTLTISGVATLTGFSGTIQPLGLTFGLAPDPAAGPTASIAGIYQSPNLNGSSGATYSVVGTQGQVFVMAVTPTVVATGSGTVNGTTGAFNVQASATVTVTGAVNVTNNTVTGTVSSAAGGPVSVAGASNVVSTSKVLVNMSARAMVNSTSPLIVGFVVNGSVPKTVVLRGVGPGLIPFGLGATLAQPKLTLYDSTGAMLGTNSGWGGSATLSSAFTALGAFGLASGSADAALQMTLAPGPYTIVISDNVNDSGGTTLAEIYDASIDPTETTQRLVNISSRGQVTAANPLLGGFVVRGNTPKKVLIRAVGPGLAAFNVPGVLADPSLSVLDLSGTVIAQNNDWETPQSVATGQTVGSAADITAADSAAGAFPLVTGSKDSAIIVTLAPGNYSAVVSGSGGTSGAALVEVYELP